MQKPPSKRQISLITLQEVNALLASLFHRPSLCSLQQVRITWPLAILPHNGMFMSPSPWPNFFHGHVTQIKGVNEKIYEYMYLYLYIHMIGSTIPFICTYLGKDSSYRVGNWRGDFFLYLDLVRYLQDIPLPPVVHPFVYWLFFRLILIFLLCSYYKDWWNMHVDLSLPK